MKKVSVKVTGAVLANIAKTRANGHEGNDRFFADPHAEELIGVKAEYAFETLTGLPMDRTQRPGGDDGCDHGFVMNGRLWRIDVKAARNPHYLLLKQKDAQRDGAEILVLAKVDGDLVEFLGWETRKTMLDMPVRDFGYGIRSQYRASSALRPMGQLITGIKKARGEA